MNDDAVKGTIQRRKSPAQADLLHELESLLSKEMKKKTHGPSPSIDRSALRLAVEEAVVDYALGKYHETLPLPNRPLYKIAAPLKLVIETLAEHISFVTAALNANKRSKGLSSNKLFLERIRRPMTPRQYRWFFSKLVVGEDSTAWEIQQRAKDFVGDLEKIASFLPSEPLKNPAHHPSHDDFHNLIASVAIIWEEVTGERVTTTPGTLFEEFAETVVEHVDKSRLRWVRKSIHRAVANRNAANSPN